MKRRSKFNAIPTTVDGIKFPSKREAKRWGELRLLEKAGKITGLRRQVPFNLVVCLEGPGTRTTIGKYIADFVYFEDRKPVVEDCKGFRTALYRRSKKHMEAQYGIQIRET